MSKQDCYSAKPELDEFDSIGDRLALDLRKNIRQLENYPLLSDPWFEMAEIFGRVANITDVESKLPSGKKDATLWETEEQALRFIIEDGKLNLCLRLLIEFKSRQIESRRSGRGPMVDYVPQCDKFEKGVGTIMRNAWQHVEVLQTTDLPALLNHIADVLEATLALQTSIEPLLKQSDIHQRQEVLIFYYLNGLLRHIEDVREYRIMPIIRERQIFLRAISVLNFFQKNIQKAHRLIACEALALLVGTEDFLSLYPQYYDIRNAHDVEKLLYFREHVLADLITEFENKKLLRPLTEMIDKVKRQARLVSHK